jgi:hypothetical protein
MNVSMPMANKIHGTWKRRRNKAARMTGIIIIRVIESVNSRIITGKYLQD